MRRTSTALVGCVLLLLTLGIVMLASTSSVRGMTIAGDPYVFVKKQLAWLVVGICIAVFLGKLDYHLLIKMAVPLYIAAFLLMLIVLIPHIGSKIGGSRRWLRLAGFSFQPSEVGKLAITVGLAWWLSRVGRKADSLKEGLLLPMGGLGLICLLAIAEPDLGTTILIGASGVAMMFVAGTRLGYLAITCTLGLVGFVLYVLFDDVRRGRILAFIMPEQFPAPAYQLMQSVNAFISGGLFGSGLGESIQKHLYLPEAHTDFILAIIGEELGFIGSMSVVLLFLGIMTCGLMISFRSLDREGKLLAFGMTFLLVAQAAINVGVVTGCLPTKGLPLPFISYGGSSMLFSMSCIGVLLNIAAHCDEDVDEEHLKPIKNKGRSF
jgi:cell division protein FtsW